MAKYRSTLLSILDTWPSYFENMDEGLGTTYERFILHHYFEKLALQYNISSVLEVPSFGMTGISGINSLLWAHKGAEVTVIDNDRERIQKSKKIWESIPLQADLKSVSEFSTLPFNDMSFDLTWNFAALWFINNLNEFVRELKRLTRKVCFICVPNNWGIGFILRSKFSKEKIPDFYPKNVIPKKIVNSFLNQGFKKIDDGYFDIPPWPDIAMKKEDLFKKVGLGFLMSEKELVEKKNDSQQRHCIVDYFNGSNPRLEQNILKYDLLENAPFPIKQLWGHHRWFIFEPLD